MSAATLIRDNEGDESGFEYRYDSRTGELTIHGYEEENERVFIEAANGTMDITIWQTDNDGKDGRVAARISIDVAGGVDVGTYL